MRLKKDELKNKGKVETEVSEITKGELVEAFGVTKDQMVRAAEILIKDKNTEILGNSSAWLANGYEPKNYQIAEIEAMFILQGNTKGTTFKIKVNNLVFASCLILVQREVVLSMTLLLHLGYCIKFLTAM